MAEKRLHTPSQDAQALLREGRARRAGIAAARAGLPISACPHKELWLSKPWRNGWSETKDKMRKDADEAYRNDQERVPEGGNVPSKVGVRMSKARSRALLGEGFA